MRKSIYFLPIAICALFLFSINPASAQLMHQMETVQDELDESDFQPFVAEKAHPDELIFSTVQSYIDSNSRATKSFNATDHNLGAKRPLNHQGMMRDIAVSGDVYSVGGNFTDNNTGDRVEVEFDVKAFGGRLKVFDYRVTSVGGGDPARFRPVEEIVEVEAPAEFDVTQIDVSMAKPLSDMPEETDAVAEEPVAEVEVMEAAEEVVEEESEEVVEVDIVETMEEIPEDVIDEAVEEGMEPVAVEEAPVDVLLDEVKAIEEPMAEESVDVALVADIPVEGGAAVLVEDTPEQDVMEVAVEQIDEAIMVAPETVNGIDNPLKEQAPLMEDPRGQVVEEDQI